MQTQQATSAHVNPLVAETKQLSAQLSALAENLIPNLRGRVTEPALAELVRYKESLAQTVQLLEQHDVELPDHIYEYLSAPSFPVRDRLAEASRIILAAIQSLTHGQQATPALLNVVSNLETIIAQAPLAQPETPLAHWVATQSAYSKRTKTQPAH